LDAKALFKTPLYVLSGAVPAEAQPVFMRNFTHPLTTVFPGNTLYQPYGFLTERPLNVCLCTGSCGVQNSTVFPLAAAPHHKGFA